jgi:hypothetical protein
MLFVDNYRETRPASGPFLYLERSNIVHHSTVRPTKQLFYTRTALFRGCPPVGLPTHRALAMANLEATTGKRSHYRIRTVHDGKFLIFGTFKTNQTFCKASSHVLVFSSRYGQHHLGRSQIARHCFSERRAHDSDDRRQHSGVSGDPLKSKRSDYGQT